MKRVFLPILTLLAALCSPGLRAATIETLAVPSASMGCDVAVDVIAPDLAALKYGQRLPVLYLLHGHGGDAHNWRVVMPNLSRMADRDGVVVVCPDGRTSWYWDSPVDSTLRYETFLSRELPAHIDSLYRTVADRRGRAVTGWSMGGHGAMWLAMRHPDVFGAAGSSSGALDIRPFPDNWNIKDRIGPKADNEARWDDYTAIGQIGAIRDGELALLVDCGYGDFFFDVNQAFHQRLMERGIRHDYIVRPGVHEAAYWLDALDYQWLFFRKFFSRCFR